MQYNGTIIFCVPQSLVMKAVGKGGENIKHISEILKKRVKIIPCPKGIEDAKYFIANIVRPVTFKDLEVKENEIILNAGGILNKSALIGRDKRRLLEMQKIVKDYFGKDFRII
jgi:transcription antitermination factor NusA-like protein